MADREPVPKLDSYRAVDVPATYWVDMSFDGTEWRPTTPLAMPAHHATRLELANLEAFPALARHRDDRVRFTIEITSRDSREVSPHSWRTTYHARIVGVCVVDPA